MRAQQAGPASPLLPRQHLHASWLGMPLVSAAGSHPSAGLAWQ